MNQSRKVNHIGKGKRIRKVNPLKNMKQISTAAVCLLLLGNMAKAETPLNNPFANAVENAAGIPSVVPSAPSAKMPFEPHSLNPLDAYRGSLVAPPSLVNSSRLDSLIRDGKLYLSLQNAIDLALENNLDLVIARYNLPIAQTDIQRTSAGGQVRGVNTGVVSGTPGGGQGGFGTGAPSAGGGGAGGTSAGAGGAGAGASGLVQSTLGTGTSVSGYDPQIGAQVYVDHLSEQLSNFRVEGVSLYKIDTRAANLSYSQAFPTGGSLDVAWSNNRQTSNGIYDYFSPQLFSKVRVIAQQELLAGFGLGPNLRFLRIARTNQKIGDIAFRAQVIATVTQICDIYWDLVSAYDEEQLRQRSVTFAHDRLETSQKQFQLQAIPEMDVLKAKGDLAQRQQELTVARTALELQQLLMKNAITRKLEDPVLEEMPVVPVDRIAVQPQTDAQPVQALIDTAMKNRTELEESGLDLQNRELSRKTARNALLPTLSVYGLYAGAGLGGHQSPSYFDKTIPTTLPPGYGGVLQSTLNNSAPEYQVGFQVSVPLRNRVAKADQYRTELEYRQSQVYLEELKKRIRIEVRNAHYAVEQSASRIEAAREARDLAQKTLDIMQQEQKLGAGSNQQTLASEHDLALAESTLVTAETTYEKARVEVRRASGMVLEAYGISIAEARSGVVEAKHSQ